jgi:hypothetical protein
LEYVDWFTPPAELEAAHYRQQAALAEAGYSTP